jgi:hypothetical protein
MKIMFYCSAVFLLALAPFAVSAVVPELELPVALQSGGENIVAGGGHAAPEAVDWNNDGRKDLLVGQHSTGWIRLYSNVGTNEEPVFDGYEVLMAAGVPLSVGYT